MELAGIGILADVRDVWIQIKEKLRGTAGRADHGAEFISFRIAQRAADGLRKFARLAAEFPVAETSFGGAFGNAQCDEEFFFIQICFKKACQETLDRHLPSSLGYRNDCDRTEERKRARPVGSLIS